MNDDESLLARWLADDLSDDEQEAFARRLAGEPELRAQLGRHLEIDGLLGPVMEDEFTRERMASRIIGAAHAADGDEFADGVRQRIRSSQRRRALGWTTAAAAAVALCFGLWMQREQPLGTVVRTGSVDSAAEIHEGMKIHAGDGMNLKSGLVELEMAGRGRMVLEGPVEVKWLGPLHASIKHGRMLMRVTPAGHGYQVETPGGKIIDLGTEFGISVDSATKRVETHVLDGEVQAVVGDQPPVNLHKNDALRFGDVPEQRIPADPGSFYSGLPPVSATMPGMIHWSMDLQDGGIARSNGSGFGSGNFDFIPMNSVSGGGPAAVAGKVGGAAAFDGKGSFMESGFLGVGGSDPRTVCFWVKVPRDLSRMEGFAMISWGKFGALDPGSVWQLSINPRDQDGPVGRLRVGAHGGIAIGSRDLRDDQWHHVGVVLYPVTRPNIGKHVLLYIDGELESVSSRTFGEVDTKLTGAKHGVWLGRDVTREGVSIPPGQGGYFRGTMDEVYIFGGSLSQEQIRRVMDDQLPR